MSGTYYKPLVQVVIALLFAFPWLAKGQDTLGQNVKESPTWDPPPTERTKTPCQTILNHFDTLSCQPIPEPENGFLYLKVCLGDSTFFKITSAYPQNGTWYAQHDSLSVFNWDFGDGTHLTTENPMAWHTYDTAKGFEMNVFITDTNGCNSVPIIARVTVTQNPISRINSPPNICLEDTVNILASSFMNFSPFTYSQTSSQRFDSVMFIPDGPNCDPTNPCYNTDVVFTSFLPGQTINNASDILSICVLMEHSYVGDLNFRINCPNGQTDTLKSYIHWGGADMGIRGTPDNGCLAKNNPQGTPWNYCWSELYPNIGTINANAGVARLDSTNRTDTTTYYLPDQTFTNLVGCPLNGIWTIEICDKWSADNGYIFEWTLNLSPSLLPQSWGYTANIDTSYIVGPYITGYTPTGAAIIVPTTPGVFAYTAFIGDEFGCLWDTTVYLEVLPRPNVDLGPDVEICQGDQAQLNAGGGMEQYQWSTGATSQQLVVNQGGTYWVEVTAENGCTDFDQIEVIMHALPSPILIKHE